MPSCHTVSDSDFSAFLLAIKISIEAPASTEPTVCFNDVEQVSLLMNVLMITFGKKVYNI